MRYLKIVLLIVFIGLFIAPASATLMIGGTPSYSAYTGGTYNGVEPANITDGNFSTSDVATFSCTAGSGCAGTKANAVVQDFTYPYRLQNITIKFEVTGTQGYSSPLLYASVLNYQTGLWENTYIQEVTVGNIYNGTVFFNGSVIARYVRIYVTFVQAASSGGQNYKNWELRVYGDQTYDTLNITSPVNKSVNQSRSQSLQWRSSFDNAPYIINTSLNANMSSNNTVATVTDYTSYDGLYYYWSTPTLYFAPNTTYYWQPNDIFNNNVTGNFTTIYEPPGTLNIQVKDEQTGDQIYIFNTTIEGANHGTLTKGTIYGWTNFTSSEVSSGTYVITVIPSSNLSTSTVSVINYQDNTTTTSAETTGTGYSQRTLIVTSPSNVTMYVPNMDTNINVVNQVTFQLEDLSTRFPTGNTILYIYKNNTLMYSNYFESSSIAYVNLIAENRYYISVENYVTSSVYVYGNFVPQKTFYSTSKISITNFAVNQSDLYPISYNVTYDFDGYDLEWIDYKNKMNSLTFKLYNSTENICSYTSTAKAGQYTVTCLTGYIDTFNFTLSFNMTDGTFLNLSQISNTGVGRRVNATGTSLITGEPVGTGFNLDKGTWHMPEYVYTWLSIILILLILCASVKRDASVGVGFTLIAALILEYYGWFRPYWNDTLSDTVNLATQNNIVGLTVGLLFFTAIIIYKKHME